MTFCDKLIAVISSRAKVCLWGSHGFFALCEELRQFGQAQSVEIGDWELLDCLNELGFLRIQGDHVLVEAPCLVLSAVEPATALLTGQRIPNYVGQVKNVAAELGFNVDEKLDEQGLWPNRLVITRGSGNADDFIKLAQKVNPKLAFCPLPLAYAYARDAVPLKNKVDDLTFNDTLQPVDEARWFNPSTLRFDGFPPPTEGFSLAMFKQHATRFDLYRRGAKENLQVSTGIPPAVGKWWTITRSGRSLFYDAQRNRAAVPRFARLPSCLGRSLAMSQLGPPRQVFDRCDSLWTRSDSEGELVSSIDSAASPTARAYWLYEGVPEVIAVLVARGLCVELRRCSLETVEEKACKIL